MQMMMISNRTRGGKKYNLKTKTKEMVGERKREKTQTPNHQNPNKNHLEKKHLKYLKYKPSEEENKTRQQTNRETVAQSASQSEITPTTNNQKNRHTKIINQCQCLILIDWKCCWRL